ncbi:MAG: hypothetical protein U0625_00755 [Phycisphaerales bacterium]
MKIRSGWCVIALSSGLFVNCAMAQVAAYEVIDLGALPSSADPKSGAWAINDRHEVVGWAIDPLFQTHAALWLYCPNYGLAAGQWHDLTVMGGETEFGEAFDINMSGLVVGRQTVSTSNGWTRGYIWDVGASPLVTTELGTFTGGAATEGLACAVNDASPAIVVGVAQAPVDPCPNLRRNQAFSYTYGDPPMALTALGMNPGNGYSQASGVNNASPPRASGRSSDELCPIVTCRPDASAVLWTVSASPTLTTLPDGGAAYGAQAWGINDAGQSVGLAIQPGPWCLKHAAFWQTSTSAPIDLGSVGIGGAFESRAFRLNEASSSGEVTIVGADDFNVRAYRWYRDAVGTWTGVDLNLLISPLCGWTLYEAHDVSSDGWIVGDGLVTPPGSIWPEYHAFLLKPVTCPGDLDGSCTVNGADLGILLGAWGCGTPCPACRADLNMDGLINGADLGLLLGAWGTSCECWSCLSGNRAASAHETSPELESKLFEGLSILGFGSLGEFHAWQRSRSAEQNAETVEWLFVYLTARN